MGKEETVNVCSGGWQLVAATLSPRLPWKHWIGFDTPPISIKNIFSCMGTLVLELGIGLGHSSSGRLILIPHPGIGIGYWIVF